MRVVFFSPFRTSEKNDSSLSFSLSFLYAFYARSLKNARKDFAVTLRKKRTKVKTNAKKESAFRESFGENTERNFYVNVKKYRTYGTCCTEVIIIWKSGKK
jgi:hypothetical protein